MPTAACSVSRRQALRYLAITAGALGASMIVACGSTPQPPTSPKPADSKPAEAKPAEAKPVATTAPAAAPKAAEPPASGGKIVIGQDVAPVNLDVQRSGSFPSVEAFEHIYESLARFDENLQVQPSLAESWETPDPTTYTFHLRRGVKWHNGREFVASDVVFWHQRVSDPKIGSPDRPTFSPIEQVEALDDYTARMKLKKPFASLIPSLAAMRGSGIPNRETVEQHGDLTTHAVGTGPYKLAEYVPNDYTRYVRNPDYWVKGLPLIDEITLKVMPEEDQRIAALRAGQIHIGSLSAVGAQRLANEKSVTVMQSPKAQLWMVQMNAQKKPWDDIRVRKALSMAIDRRAIVEKAAQGAGVLSGPVPTGHTDWYIPEDKLPYRQDIEGAKKLLAEAGYPNGLKATIKTSNAYREMVASSVEIKNQLQAVGIDLTVEQLEWTQLLKVQAVAGDPNTIPDYELTTSRFIFFPDPDGYIGRFTPERNAIISSSATALQDDRITQLLDMAEATTDHAERKKLYDEAQMRMMNDVLNALWVFNGSQIDGVSNALKGYKQSFTGYRYLIRQAWLSQG